MNLNKILEKMESNKIKIMKYLVKNSEESLSYDNEEDVIYEIPRIKRKAKLPKLKKGQKRFL